MYWEIHPNLSNLFFYFCSLSKGDSYGDRHPAGPDLASFVYQRSCSVITATIVYLLCIDTELSCYQCHPFLPTTSTPLG